MIVNFLKEVHDDYIIEIDMKEKEIEECSSERMKYEVRNEYLKKSISNDDIFNPNSQMSKVQEEINLIRKKIQKLTKRIDELQRQRSVYMNKSKECELCISQMQEAPKEDQNNFGQVEIAQKLCLISETIFMDPVRARIETDELIRLLK